MPKEFPSLLKAFTRECLRAQPSNIYEFGAQYFSELQAQQDADAAGDSGPRRLSPAELQELLSNMFHEADTDGSGALSLNEFKEVLKMADLGLSDRETKYIMAEADMDGNGEISYEEFIPLAVELVHAMYARMDAEAARAADEEDARNEAKEFLVHGMKKEEVEAIMSEIFRKSDVDGSGKLDAVEFQKCCKDADIGLTRKEINVLMHQCDVDGDGTISYDEFIPLCFEMLTEIMKDELLVEKRGNDQLNQFLESIWAQADQMQEGLLDPVQMKQALVHADLGLNKVQLHSVLSEAAFDDQGLCDYMKFVPKAADLIYRMLDVDAQLERRAAIEQLTGFDPNMVKGMSQAQVQEVLLAEFDAATHGAGVISMQKLMPVLSSSQLGLTPNECAALVSVGEPVDGKVDYVGLCSYAFYVLQYIAQEGAINS